MQTLPFTTQGLNPVSPNFTGLVTGGVPAAPLPPPAAATTATFPYTQVAPTLTIDQTVLADVLDVAGNPVVKSPNAAIDMGQGKVLTFDSATLDARIHPVLDPVANTGVSVFTDGEAAFSGSSCRIMIEIPQTPSFNGSSVQQAFNKQLLEATAITISTHRAKTQVRPFGYINPKGIARGSRTIAGTLILNKFTTEVLYRFLQSGLMADISKDTAHNKLDQLPPFNFTLFFSNEQGYISTQCLYGVEFVTDGSVIGVQDILLEQTLTYFAVDMSPLVPLNFSTLFNPSTTQSPASAPQRTVSSLWKSA
jgi:hypothetical protein